MLGILGFKLDLFTRDFWGTGGDLGSTMDQVKNMMLLVTVWVFIGIEGAAVYSGRAKHRRDIGRATVGGFFIVLALMVLVIMLCAEIVQVAGADGTMPAALGRLNAHDSPANAMWLTSICMQVVLLGTGLLGGDVYLKLILVATSMILIPHLLSAMFGASVALRAGGAGRFRVAMPSLVATVYSVWLLYAAGPAYLLLSTLLYAPGLIVHAINRRQQGARLFTRSEGVLALIIVCFAVLAAVALALQWLSI